VYAEEPFSEKHIIKTRKPSFASPPDPAQTVSRRMTTTDMSSWIGYPLA
jgi:hypothetical protein